ncbi:MAG: molecular chaperone DnaJ [Patescibacteria group bacterium]|nr:MAG: molecular chaperone DnaJ [Patescibacteria group bacterium]
MAKDYYAVLGVARNASEEDVKKAFRKKAHEHHPDKAGGDEAKFKEINEAYQVLSNKERRARYDQFGSGFENGQAGAGQAGHGFGGFNQGGFNINMDDFGDIFGDIFGFGGGRSSGSAKAGSQRGNDLQLRIEIEFMEAVFGTEKTIKVNKGVVCKSCSGSGAEPGSKIETCPQCHGQGRVTQMQRTILGHIQMQTVCPSCRGEGKKITNPCSTCRGTGVSREAVELKVKIPAGIDNGETIRLSGEGEAGAKNGDAGDLYLHITVKSDSRFKREGETILSNLEITFPEAALGTTKDILTVDGEVRLKIPAGTQSNKVFVLKNKGVHSLRSRGRGDHLVTVTVKTPTTLTRKQKKLLEEFEEE